MLFHQVHRRALLALTGGHHRPPPATVDFRLPQHHRAGQMAGMRRDTLACSRLGPGRVGQASSVEMCLEMSLSVYIPRERRLYLWRDRAAFPVMCWEQCGSCGDPCAESCQRGMELLQRDCDPLAAIAHPCGPSMF